MAPIQVIECDEDLLQEGKLRVFASLPFVHHSAQMGVGTLFLVHASELLTKRLQPAGDLMLELAEILADIR